MIRHTSILFVVFCIWMLLTTSIPVFASTTDGTIDSTNKYAWGENVGWINFGSDEGNVHITPTAMTGYAWGENVGWISLNCSNDNSCDTVDYGVENDRGGGNLSGYAWGENVGWINFDPTYSGVVIDRDGTFSGYAWGENVGWISFNCSNTDTCSTVDYKVDSDYEPAPSSGGGNPGGGPTEPETTIAPTSTPTSTPTPTISITPIPSIPPPTGTPTQSPFPSPTVLPPVESPPPVQPTSPPPYVSPPPTLPDVIVDTIDVIGRGIDGAVQGVADAAENAGSVLTETEPIPIPQPVQEVARKIIQYVPGRERTINVVSALGTAVSATTTVLSLSTIFGGAFNLLNYGSYLGISLLELLALRKRRTPWGTVYDAYTKRPIPFAKTQLLDEQNRVLETRITDAVGRYGFLVTPEHFGTKKTVQLNASKSGYVFPAQSVSGVRDTILYDNVYTGGLRTVRVDEVANFNVPLDPLVRAEAAGYKPPSVRLNTTAVVAANIGFWFATIAAPMQYLARPSLLNLIFAGIIILLAVMRGLGLKARPFGVVLGGVDGDSLPFTLITLNDTFGRRVGFTVADEYGRYFLLTEQGSYTLNAHTPATIVPDRTVTIPFTTRKGWITRKIVLPLGSKIQGEMRPSIAGPVQEIKKLFLIVLDGFGLSSETYGNAIALAKMPYINSLISQYPSISLVASSLVVGLPWGQYGNSEVGHSAIGAGRIVVQDLARINDEIRTKLFFENKAVVDVFNHAESNKGNIHLIGCVSPGGIHSHEDHLYALLELAKKRGMGTRTFVHFIVDGQDTGPEEGIKSLERLMPHLESSGARIASMNGRTFAMDRVLNWKLTERVWRAVVDGDGPRTENPAEYLSQSYMKNVFDRDIEPATVITNGMPVSLLNDNDAVFFFNFRNDRMKQLIQPFLLERFDSFERKRIPKNLYVASMARYADEFDAPVAYEALDIKNTAGEIVSENGWRQYRIAEKEKEAHVTNFFNGGRISPFPGEERIIVSSRMLKGREYIEYPEMSADKVVQAVLEKKDSDARLFVINFANPDMIGHAGNLDAAIKACIVIDECMKELIPKLIEQPDCAVLITADHGNAEEMIDPKTGGEDTQHSTNNVPAIFVGRAFDGRESGKTLSILADERPLGTLADVAPTVLKLFGLEQPKEMTGSSLL